MRRRAGTLTILFLAVALGALAPPAPAQAPGAVKTDNVTALGTLNEPNVISARFKGTLMYLSHLRGMSIYDVTDPAKPVRLSTLALPHFQNEDIDVGNGIAMISNDPSEGKGQLHIVDVKDPADPKLLTSYDTGIIDLGFEPPFAEEAGVRYGIGHTASCIQDCRYAWLAGTLRGIDVIDLTNPSSPKFVKRLPLPEVTGPATHDVQLDAQGLAWVAGGNGTAAYDVTDPLNPVLRFRTDESAESDYLEDLGADGGTLNDLVHHNSLRLRNGSLAAPPPGADPNADSDIVTVTEEDYTRPGCVGAGSFQTWRISPDKRRDGTPVLENLDTWGGETEGEDERRALCSAHYHDERGGLVVQGWYEAGTRFLDVSNPADIRQVAYFIPGKALTWGAYFPPTDPTGELVYSLDHPRGVDILRVDRPNAKQTVSVPKPSGSGGGGGGGAGPAAGGRPNVTLRITDRRETARRGQHLRFRATVVNRGDANARDVVARVRVRNGLGRLRGKKRTLVIRAERLRPQETKTSIFRAFVPRRGRIGRRTLVSGRVTAPNDANPLDDRAYDANRIVRRRRGARPRALAAGNAAMPTVASPILRGRDARALARDVAFACRLAL